MTVKPGYKVISPRAVIKIISGLIPIIMQVHACEFVYDTTKQPNIPTDSTAGALGIPLAIGIQHALRADIVIALLDVNL